MRYELCTSVQVQVFGVPGARYHYWSIPGTTTGVLLVPFSSRLDIGNWELSRSTSSAEQRTSRRNPGSVQNAMKLNL